MLSHSNSNVYLFRHLLYKSTTSYNSNYCLTRIVFSGTFGRNIHDLLRITRIHARIFLVDPLGFGLCGFYCSSTQQYPTLVQPDFSSHNIRKFEILRRTAVIEFSISSFHFKGITVSPHEVTFIPLKLARLIVLTD